MTPLRDICNACAPESLERSPTLPTVPRQGISALQHCRSGHSGYSLSQCHSCGKHHRVNHAWGKRHGPQWQHHKTPQWCQHHLDTQLPGPHFLLTCTVPAPLRPFLRSHQRLTSPAMFHASSHALQRLAQEERFLGTNLPGLPSILHPWGRQLQSHPHIHSIVPGGGLSEDRTTWLPSRAHCYVPVNALSPISRALCKEAMAQAGLLAQTDPLVRHPNWNVHSQANPNGHTSFTYLAPDVCQVALSNSRLVSRTDRTVTVTSRKPGRARSRTAPLDGRALLRRFLQPVLPHGFMTVRHCGFLHASCAIPPDTLRRMIVQAHPSACKPTQSGPPAPLAALCPPCGAQRRVVMRLWTANRAFGETG